MKTCRPVAGFDIDLNVAGQEKNVPRWMLVGERFRVTAKLVAGAWGSVTLAVKRRSGLAAPANFTGSVVMSAALTSADFTIASEAGFDELCVITAGAVSAGGWVRVEVSEEVDTDGGKA